MRWFTLSLLLTSPLAAQAADTTATRTTAVLYVTEYTPPAEYKSYYKSMEKCLGMRGDFGKVKWYSTPTPWSDGRHGNNKTFGQWQYGHRITVNLQDASDSVLASHEMVHDILSYHLDPDDPVAHPMPYFSGRCASEFYYGRK